jgi:hypothetical protein
MAIDKIQSESINLADNFAFTGTVTGAGGVNTPAFEARLSSAQLGVSSATLTKIAYATELFDTDSNYDTSNYRFTPTTAGKYHVYVTQRITTTNNTTLKRTILKVYKNGSIYENSETDFNLEDSKQRATSPSVQATISMNGSSDYIEIYGYVENSDGATTSTGFDISASVFGAYKIIE